MSSLADDLRAARALIDTPEKWGRGLASFTRQAGPLCAAGACAKVADTFVGNHDYSLMWDALSILLDPEKYPREISTLPGGDVSTFNDDPATTHADIMALFDRAIDAALASTKIEEKTNG